MRIWQLLMMALMIISIVVTADPADARKKRKKKNSRSKPPAAMVIKEPEKKTPSKSEIDTSDVAEDEEEEGFQNPYADMIWTKEDVMRFCANKTHGPRSYKSCVQRNERRVGRRKTSYDKVRIGN